MKQETLYPYELLKQMQKKAFVKQILSQLEEEKDPLVAFSSEQVLSALHEIKNGNFLMELEHNVIAALASWRLSKMVYRFNPELTKILLEQAEDIRIPVDVLYRLPYKCIYIDAPGFYEGISGFFVLFDFSYTKDEYELKIVYEDRGLSVTIPIHLIKGKTVSECMEITDRETDKYLIENKVIGTSQWGVLSYGRSITQPIAQSALQLILYICAANADIQENPKQKQIYKKPSGKPKDQFKEVRKYDVGEVFVRTLRQLSPKVLPSNRSAANVSFEGSRASGYKMRPHMRRGHWHHYWSGKRNSSDRQLKLVWVAPVFVNAEDSEEQEAPTTVVNV